MNTIYSKKPIHILTGIVVHGCGIGKYVGSPTANIAVESKEDIPATGVYISQIRIDKQVYYGVTHIGTQPTINNSQTISIGTHILDFDQNIYDCIIQVTLYKKLRDIQKFKNFSFLLEQIKKDCMAARKFWGLQSTAPRLVMKDEQHIVRIDNHEICLSKKEFDVLYFLYTNPTTAFTKEQIYETVWQQSANQYCHAVENTIFQIRKKLKPYSNYHDYIKTIVGYGYKFNM